MRNELNVTRTVPLPRGEVFAFLERLENHWSLSSRFEVLDLYYPEGSESADGAKLRVRGPLGLVKRTVETRMCEVQAPAALHGEAWGGETRGRVSWAFEAVGDSATRVSFSLCFTQLAGLDALALALGVRPWLRHEMGSILKSLPALIERNKIGLPANARGSLRG